MRTVARHSQILDAAAALVEKTGGTDFTMLEVATRSGVSPATPYNLFGSKSALLFAVLDRSAERIVKTFKFSSPDPLEHPVEAAEKSVAILVRGSRYYRALFLEMPSMRGRVNRHQFVERNVRFWKESLKAAVSAGLLHEDVDQEDLAWALVVHFAGVVELWIHDFLDDESFRAQIVYGTALHLLAVASGPSRSRLLKRMQRARRRRRRNLSSEPAARRRTAQASVRRRAVAAQ